MELRKINKRGAMDLQSITMTLIVVGIMLGLAFLVLSDFMGDMGAGTDAEDAVNQTIQALKVIPSYLDTIILVAIIGIILAVVFVVARRYGGNGGEI